MQQPVEKPIELGLPAESSVLYIQTPDETFEMIPADASMLKRTIQIGPDPTFPYITSGFVRLPRSTSIFTGINWGEGPSP
jgi:hypothetical protein